MNYQRSNIGKKAITEMSAISSIFSVGDEEYVQLKLQRLSVNQVKT